MKICDITEAIVNGFKKKFFDEWRHERYIDGFSSEKAYLVVDGKRYCITVTVREMTENEN